MRRAAVPSLVLLALGLAACRAGAPATENAPPLDVAATALDLGEPDVVERQLEPLFVDGAPTVSPRSRRRAAWLLAQGRALRALEVGSESPTARSQGTALRVGALYFADLAVAEQGASDRAPAGPDEFAADGEPLRGGLGLLRATLLDELGFQERSAWILDSMAGPEGREAVAALLERSGLHERLRPRVWLALFHDRARRDPARAFPLAVEALSASDRRRGTLERGEIRAVEGWIEEDAPYLFRCPDCGQPAVPQLRACPNDQTRLERFTASPRP